MKKSLLATGLFLIATMGLCAQSAIDKPLAVVNLTKTEQIGSRSFLKQMESAQLQLGVTFNNERKKQYLDSRVDTLLIGQAAEKEKITVTSADVLAAVQQQKVQQGGAQISDEMYKAAIKQKTGMNWEEYLATIHDQMLLQKYLFAKKPGLQTAKYTVTEEEILAIYEEQAARFVTPSMVRFNYLRVDTRKMDTAQKQKAKQMMDDFAKQVKSGGQASFDDLSKKSVDSVNYEAGDSGFIPRGDAQYEAIFGKSFFTAVFKLSQGAISPVLESNVGYYLISITERRKPRLAEIDKPMMPGQKMTPYENIQQALTMQKQNEAITKSLDELLKDLRKTANVTYFEKNYPW